MIGNYGRESKKAKNSHQAPYKGRRKECPHCKGRGHIKKEDAEDRYL